MRTLSGVKRKGSLRVSGDPAVRQWLEDYLKECRERRGGTKKYSGTSERHRSGKGRGGGRGFTGPTLNKQDSGEPFGGEEKSYGCSSTSRTSSSKTKTHRKRLYPSLLVKTHLLFTLTEGHYFNCLGVLLANSGDPIRLK